LAAEQERGGGGRTDSSGARVIALAPRPSAAVLAVLLLEEAARGQRGQGRVGAWVQPEVGPAQPLSSDLAGAAALEAAAAAATRTRERLPWFNIVAGPGIAVALAAAPAAWPARPAAQLPPAAAAGGSIGGAGGAPTAAASAAATTAGAAAGSGGSAPAVVLVLAAEDDGGYPRDGSGGGSGAGGSAAKLPLRPRVRQRVLWAALQRALLGSIVSATSALHYSNAAAGAAAAGGQLRASFATRSSGILLCAAGGGDDDDGGCDDAARGWIGQAGQRLHAPPLPASAAGCWRSLLNVLEEGPFATRTEEYYLAANAGDVAPPPSSSPIVAASSGRSGSAASRARAGGKEIGREIPVAGSEAAQPGNSRRSCRIIGALQTDRTVLAVARKELWRKVLPLLVGTCSDDDYILK
jgi:hypothetical protein